MRSCSRASITSTRACREAKPGRSRHGTAGAGKVVTGCSTVDRSACGTIALISR
jgi:hypothetical protein